MVHDIVVNTDYYEIIKGNTRKIKKYNSDQIEYYIKYKNIESELVESLETVDKLFNAVIKDISHYITPQDSIKIYIDHPNFTDDIQTKFQKGKDLNAKVVIDTISRLMQSGKILSLDDKLKFSVLIIREISGAGLKRIGEYLYKKQCVVRIKKDNEDSLCGLRAIVLGMSYVNNDNYDQVRDSRNNIQNRNKR